MRAALRLRLCNADRAFSPLIRDIGRAIYHVFLTSNRQLAILYNENPVSLSETDPQVAETTHAGIGSRRLKPVWWLAMVALFFLALWAWSELRIRMARVEIEELRAANQALQHDSERMRAQNERSVAALRLLSAGGTRTINMTGSDAASARLYYDPAQRRALGFFYNLSPTPPDKSYQLWVLRTGQATPHSAAVFETPDRRQVELTLENLPDLAEMRSLSLTLEPRGGSPAPTGRRFPAGRVQ